MATIEEIEAELKHWNLILLKHRCFGKNGHILHDYDIKHTLNLTDDEVLEAMEAKKERFKLKEKLGNAKARKRKLEARAAAVPDAKRVAPDVDKEHRSSGPYPALNKPVAAPADVHHLRSERRAPMMIRVSSSSLSSASAAESLVSLASSVPPPLSQPQTSLPSAPAADPLRISSLSSAERAPSPPFSFLLPGAASSSSYAHSALMAMATHSSSSSSSSSVRPAPSSSSSSTSSALPAPSSSSSSSSGARPAPGSSSSAEQKPCGSLPISASSSSSASHVKPESSRCKWCGAEGCDVCAVMKDNLTDGAFLQLTGAIAAHQRNPAYVAQSHVKMDIDFWAVVAKAHAEGAKVFKYTTDEHDAVRAAPCRYCGAAWAGMPMRAEHTIYEGGNVVSLCAFCAMMKDRISEKVFLEKCVQIDARNRRCKCNAPRFMDTGMCAKAVLGKMCSSASAPK